MTANGNNPPDPGTVSLSRYWSLCEKGRVGYVTVDPGGKILWTNLSGARMLGTTREEAVSQDFSAHLAPESRPDFPEFLSRAFANGPDVLETTEVTLPGADGSPRFLRMESLVSGAPPECQLALVDVTAAHWAEDEVRQFRAGIEHAVRIRTSELEAGFQAVEAFSSSVTHDLRDPLLTIDGFVAKLTKKTGGKLDEEERRLLGVIRDTARHMGRLVDDLVHFSRTSRIGMRQNRIDMDALFDGVLTQQLPPEESVKTELHLGSLPIALGDETLVRAAVQNLVSNAVKFSSTRPRRLLEIGWREGDQGGYFIRDNGIGIDPENAHDIFGVFRRHHSQKDFGGTGIGLALVKRVIERHGGKVWAESEPGSGATFWFRLPLA